MAYKKTNNRLYSSTYHGNKKTYSKKRSYSNEMASFARKMGQVARGLQNPASIISESYKSGLEKSEKPKKSLF